jgi:hypothetical protein
MELNGDETIAELAALQVAVKRLLEVANDQSVEKGQFARNALKKGLADLTDIDYWARRRDSACVPKPATAICFRISSRSGRFIQIVSANERIAHSKRPVLQFNLKTGSHPVALAPEHVGRKGPTKGRLGNDAGQRRGQLGSGGNAPPCLRCGGGDPPPTIVVQLEACLLTSKGGSKCRILRVISVNLLGKGLNTIRAGHEAA